MIFVSSTLLALLLIGSSFVKAALYDRVIHTKHGDVVGYPAFNSSPAGNLTNWQDITVWKGIPFAATTGGSNRWKPPQPLGQWNATLYASSFGPVCPASVGESPPGGNQTGGSQTNYPVDEDCLTLNIWSAANSSAAKMPVVMWSYPAGSTAEDDLFTGGGMAAKDIVFVNYNYRTGSFGWLSHPELSQERMELNGHNSSGNYGMLDQFAALKWIRANIAGFGGDPDHITVMGQSAGSAATYHVVNSPLTKGDIVGAIIESGVRDPHDPQLPQYAEGYLTLEDNLAQGVKFLAYLNVTTIEKARQLPYTDLVTSLSLFGCKIGWNFEAVLDYYAMPDTYLNTLLKGAANQVPIITGNAHDEDRVTLGLNISLAAYEAYLNTTYNGTFDDHFLDLYPGMTQPQHLLRKTHKYSIVPSSAHGNGLSCGRKPQFPQSGTIFGIMRRLVRIEVHKSWTSADYAIARAMNSYWANFIKHGNPNGVGLNHWSSATELCNQTVQRLGNAFAQIPIAEPDRVELVGEWFAHCRRIESKRLMATVCAASSRSFEDTVAIVMVY